MAETAPKLRLIRLDTVDSTNTYLKRLALAGAAHGTVVAAETQTAGRGRLGRRFESRGKGLYFSVLLRPSGTVESLAGLTCTAAVAVCRAIETVCGLSPRIKWTNDLIIGRRKLCGILTELATDPAEGKVKHVIVGIGINVNEEPGDFPPELADSACSLRMACGHTLEREPLLLAASAGLLELFPAPPPMDEYRRRCATIGSSVCFDEGGRRYTGTALSVADDGALSVALDVGGEKTVRFGDVSVRTWAR